MARKQPRIDHLGQLRPALAFHCWTFNWSRTCMEGDIICNLHRARFGLKCISDDGLTLPGSNAVHTPAN